MQGHLCGCDLVLVWAVGTGLSLPLPVELRNGHPQKKTRSKMGRNYLGLDTAGTEL